MKLDIFDMFLWYLMIKLFEPMIRQVQGIVKDMNEQCNVSNIGQPVLQVMTEF